MKIKIADRTLCQEENSFSFKEKIEIARQLEKLNVNTIEIGALTNVKTDTLLIRTIASFVKNSCISVGVGRTKESVIDAAHAIASANKKRLRVEVPVSTVGMEYSFHLKAPKMVELVSMLSETAKEKCDDVELCCLDATRAESETLEAVIKAAVEKGVKTVTLCDNAAEMMPNAFGEFVKNIREKFENITIGIMCDNKNGLGAANAVTAVDMGASIIKTDVCAGGIPLETMAGIIKNCGEKYNYSSDVKYTELNRIIKQINWIIGNSRNEKSAVTVAEREESVKLDINDTKDTVITAVLKLGYDLSEEDSDKVCEEFMRVAAKKKVGSKELDAIVASVALQVPPTYKLVSYVINNGNIISATAQITLEKDGQAVQGISFGDGPVDSAFLAIEQIIGHHYELDDFQIQSVTEGKEAMGSALVKLRQGGKLYSGNGISTDIIGAGIRAYLSAVNKIVYEEEN